MVVIRCWWKQSDGSQHQIHRKKMKTVMVYNVMDRLDYTHLARDEGWRCIDDLEVDSNLPLMHCAHWNGYVLGYVNMHFDDD